MSAFRIRIDEMIDSQQAFRIAYTVGIPPLGAPSGSEVEFPNKQAFVEAMDALAIELSTNQLIALAAATTYKSDPDMSDLSSYAGRYFQLDLTGAALAVDKG